MANYVFPKVDEVKPPHSKRDLSLYKQSSFTVGTLNPILTIDLLPDDWLKCRTVASLESLPMLGPVRGRWKLSFDYYFEPWSNLYGYMDNNKRMNTEDIIDEHMWIIPVGGFQQIGFDNPYEAVDFLSLQELSHGCRFVGKGSLLDYLGCPVGYFGEVNSTGFSIEGGGTITVNPKQYNASGFLTYLDIVRNYYVNPQERNIPFISSGLYSNILGVESNITESYSRMSLSYLDDYFMTLRYKSRNGLISDVASIIPDASEMSAIFDESGESSVPVGRLLSSAQGIVTNHNGDELYTGSVSGGLFLRSYRMDLLRGIMNNTVGQYKSIVDTSSGGFDVTTLMFANKLQTLINRIDITGGRFTDWIRTRWGVKPSIEVDRPIYLGSHSTWLDTLDVVATAAGNSGDDANSNSQSNLGQQVSYGKGQLGAGDQRPVICSMNQYGTLQCIMSLVPDVVYSQGFELNTLKTKFMDLFDPAFNQLGYQDVLREEMSAYPVFSFNYDGASVLPNVFSPTLNYPVGKRIAWSEYMASLPRAHGDFAFGESLDWWTNGRRYTSESYFPEDINEDQLVTEIHLEDDARTTETGLHSIINNLRKCGGFDSTTYIYPHLYNGIFANQAISSLNWLISVRFDIEANRALGKRLTPHL